MAASNYTTKQSIAYHLFMHTNKLQKEIAVLAGTSEHTMSKWVEKFKWKQEKATLTVTSDKIISDIYQQIAVHNELIRSEKRMSTSAEADALAKLATIIEKLDKKLSPSIVMNAFMRFNDWLVTINPELAKQCLEYQIKYVQTLIDL